MDVELDPDQPEEVVRAVVDLLADGDLSPDPWWQAGLDEALEP